MVITGSPNFIRMQRKNAYPDVSHVIVHAVCFLGRFTSFVKGHVTHCSTALCVNTEVVDTTHVLISLSVKYAQMLHKGVTRNCNIFSNRPFLSAMDKVLN